LADETVDIGNVGKGGVASEATLESLVKAVEFLAKKEGFDPKKSAEKAKKLAKSFDDTITVVTENRDALKDHTDTVDESAESISTFSKSMSMAGKGLGVAAVSVGNFAKELISGGSNLSAFAQHIPGIGSLLIPLTGYLDDTMVAFRDLSSVGGAFNNSLQDLRLAAAETYLTLDQFSSLIANRSQDLAAFGGTVTAGAKRLVELNRGLGDQREQLLNMGFSFEEINEQLVSYQMLSRAGARAEQRSAAEQAQAAASYAKNLSTLSKLTGQEIDSINQKVAANSTDVAFQMKLAKMKDEDADKVRAAMAEATSMYGPAAAEFFKQQLLGMPPLTEETQVFAATLPGLAEEVRRLSRTAQDSSVSLDQFNQGSTDRMVAAMRAAAESGEKFESLLAATAGGLDGPGSVLAGVLEGMGKQFTDYVKVVNGRQVLDEKALRADMEAAKTETSARGAVTEQMNKFEENVKEVRKALLVAFIDSGLLDLIVTGLKHFAEFIGGFGETLVTMTDQIKEGKWLSALSTAFTNAISGAINNPGVVAAIAAIFAGPKLLSAAGAGASSLLGGLLPGGGSADDDDDDKKSKRSRKAKPALKPNQTMGGKIGGNIGGMLGGIGGGILEGITNALAGAGAKAPLIGLGAAAVGGAITLIGAGIAGATWLMGNALPSFAEGMKSFEELDGARLKQAADGMVAMTGAMAAFGAGSVVSGIGNMVGSIAEGIAGFFGGDSPLDKLQQFADADIDSDAIQQNASSINSFSDAISNLDVLPKKGVLATMGDALFGGDPQAEKAEFEANASEIKEKLDKANDWLLTAERSVSISRNRLKLIEDDYFTAGSAVTNDMLLGANIKLDNALEDLYERQQEVATLEAQLANINSQGVNASLPQQPANSTDFANLNDLDSDNVNNYREAMENLVTTLENLNGVLAENQGLDLPSTAPGAVTTAGGDTKDRLNRTMDALLTTTMQTSDYLKKIERNTKSIGGDISKGRISDTRG